MALRQRRGPRIRIDGREAPGAVWGDNEIPVAAGMHDVEVETRDRLPFSRGTAGMSVLAPESGRVELEYCAPVVALAAVVACTVGVLYI